MYLCITGTAVEVYTMNPGTYEHFCVVC